MHPAVELNRIKVTELCRHFGVKRLFLFGSAARGDFDPAASDIDLLVEFSDVSSSGYADRYLDFAQALERLLNRPVDLLTMRSVVNPILKKSIQKDQIELYAA